MPGHQGAGGIDMGHDMDRPRIGPVLVQGILMAAAADAGIGEEHVDRAVVPLGLGDEMADVGFLGDVAGHGDTLISLATDSRRPASRSATTKPLAHSLGVAPRDRLADAARRAGDDADLVFDFHFNLPIMLFRTASVPLA